MFRIQLEIISTKSADEKIKDLPIKKIENIFSSALRKEIKDTLAINIKNIEAYNDVVFKPPPNTAMLLKTLTSIIL